MTKPGRAIERSALAWQRTQLTLMAVATLLLKLALSRHRPVELVAAVLAFVEAAIIWLELSQRRRPITGVARPALLAFTAAMTAVVIILVALSLWGPSQLN